MNAVKRSQCGGADGVTGRHTRTPAVRASHRNHLRNADTSQNTWRWPAVKGGENPPQARGGGIPGLNAAVPAAAGLTRLTRLIVLAGANR